MQTADVRYKQELRQRENRNRFYTQNLFIFAVGVVLFSLGGFMVTDIHTWQAFSEWLPLALLFAGVLLISSKVYSVWTGVLLLTLSGLSWFHNYGIEHFSKLTHTIDWSFVILGAIVILLPVIRVSVRLLQTR